MRLAAVTTSRADYGLLYWPLKLLRQDEFFDLKLIVSGSHLSPTAGLTFKQIETDGFAIDWFVDMLLCGDTLIAACKSMGLATIGFAESYNALKPDLILLLGDRYEVFAAAQAAALMSIPVAHIAGGDVTEGAFDDMFRHCITKLSHIHFPTNAPAADRLLQLGEDPRQVVLAGSPGLDFVQNYSPSSREQLQSHLKFSLKPRNLLVTFHPETLDQNTTTNLKAMLGALDMLQESEFGIIFTAPNSDPGGQAVGALVKSFCTRKSNTVMTDNLGSQLYLSAISIADAVVGNSSSGLYEAPSLGTPTVNIGDRQKGRICASSVINVDPEVAEIHAAILQAVDSDCKGVQNPYGDGFASEKIVQTLKKFSNPQLLLRKSFHSIPVPCHTHS